VVQFDVVARLYPAEWRRKAANGSTRDSMLAAQTPIKGMYAPPLREFSLVCGAKICALRQAAPP
jgi:hypothetical protein